MVAIQNYIEASRQKRFTCAGDFIAHSPQTSKGRSTLRIVALREGAFDLPDASIEALSFFPLFRKKILRDDRVYAIEVSASY
jgi:hypothetical protein